MQTGKGATSPSEHTVFEYDQTGARIHQLTSHRSINHPAYFLTSSFTPDQKTLYVADSAARIINSYSVSSDGTRQRSLGLAREKSKIVQRDKAHAEHEAFHHHHH